LSPARTPSHLLPLDVDRLRRVCMTLRNIGPIQVVEETESTHVDLMTLAANGADDGTVLITEHQTSGRGRSGRVWISQQYTDVLISYLARVPLPADRMPTVNFHMGLAVSDALQQLCGNNLKLKWPNDLLIYNKKVGGILAESHVPPGNLANAYAVISLGLNVNTELEDLPSPVNEEATTIATYMKRPMDRTAILLKILDALDFYRTEMVHGEVPAERWNNRAAWVGEQVTVNQERKKVSGKLRGIRQDGALELIGDTGQIVTVTHGDLLRRA